MEFLFWFLQSDLNSPSLLKTSKVGIIALVHKIRELNKTMTNKKLDFNRVQVVGVSNAKPKI